MFTPHLAARRCALTLLCCALALRASAQPGPLPPSSSNDTVQLTPFTVSTDKDNGFIATSALTGGRLATDLRDTPGSYSVVTREFLDALNITDLQTAQNWVVGSTYLSDIGTNNFNTFTTRYTSRGVTAGQQQRNFFPTNSDLDGFDIERYDFGRGPNSILFGNGSLGGVSSATTRLARTDIPVTNVVVTVSSYDTVRATVDLNRAIGNKFAIRADFLEQSGEGWKEKDFEKRQGLYLATLFRPFHNTEFRLSGEIYDRKYNSGINNYADQFSGWDGKTTFATPAALNGASSATLTSLLAAGVSRRAANYNVYDPYNGLNEIISYTNDPITVGGGANSTTPIAGYTWAATGINFNTSGANIIAALDVPSNRFATATSNSLFRQPGQSFTLDPDAPLIHSRYQDVQATLDQQLGDFYFEIAADISRNPNKVNGEQNRGTATTYIDIDQVLPNGAPNKHYLHVYGDGNYFRGYRHYDYNNFRGAVAYKHDFNWVAVAANVLGGTNRNHYTLDYQWLSLGQGTNTLALINGTTADIKVRRYWDEKTRPITDLTVAPINYFDPNTNTTTVVKPRWVIDHTRFDTETLNQAIYDYGLAALNAQFFKDRIVLLGAVRRDYFASDSQAMAVSGDYPTDRDPLHPLFKPKAPKDWGSLTYVPINSAGVSQPSAAAITRPRLADGSRDPRYTGYRFQDDYNPPDQTGYVTTKSLGTVVHGLDWVSGTFNYSETFNPQKAYATLLNGQLLPPTVADSYEYGLRFELLKHALNLNLTYYSSREVNNGFSISGYPFNTLLQATPIGSTVAANSRGIPLVPSTPFDLQTRLAQGYEAELTANLSKGLRMIASVALPKVYHSDAYPLTRAYLAANANNFKLVAQDAGVKIDPTTNIATVDASIPTAQQSPDAQAAATAYNTINTSAANIVSAKTLELDQKVIKLFADYTIQSTWAKGVRFGAGVQYRGKQIIGYRGADTIVNPSNSLAAVDDPTVGPTTPVYTPKGDYTVTATAGYTWKWDKRAFQANLVVNNAANDRTVIYTDSTNGAATSALRPKNGDYTSPARMTVPVGVALKAPISFSFAISAAL